MMITTIARALGGHEASQAREARHVRIVIFAGGTGSVALQRGLYHSLDANLDGIDTKIIVNAYDDGLSTGAVRRVMNGQILGPSDVRKNQATRLALKDPHSPWLSFLKRRFTATPSTAREFCIDSTVELMEDLKRNGLSINYCDTVFRAIAEYFRSPRSEAIDYKDFSLANIAYAGLAKANGNSLRAAASIFAEALDIPDNVLLNDDESLFLGGITRSGKQITDEGAIVSWGNATDPFVDIFFRHADGSVGKPKLCLEAYEAIKEADLIILSCGTQWSSLIPTYASEGFKDAVNASHAEVLMVMNRTPDLDSPGQSASEIVNILVPRYFENGRLHVIADERGHPLMRDLDYSALLKVGSFTQAVLSTGEDPPATHNADRLADTIGRVFFRDYLNSDLYLFDYDDTLVARENRYPNSSRFNMSGVCRLNGLAKIGICTGNAIQSVDLRGLPAARDEALQPIYKPLVVFADGGINKYTYDTRPVDGANGGNLQPDACISSEALLPTEGPYSVDRLIDNLQKAGIPFSKINNRANALIAIKPLDADDRRRVIVLIRRMINGSRLHVRECGKTTIEICKPELSKALVLHYLRADATLHPTITYVGDELDSGNDHDVQKFSRREPGIKCLHVHTPAKTAFFISTLIAHLSQSDAA
jgi:2-phospho-L-lactate transferase/gluconeogenesis factor (CofD/UPF0052 family)